MNNCKQCGAPRTEDGLCARGHLELGRRGFMRGLGALAALAAAPALVRAAEPKIVAPASKIVVQVPASYGAAEYTWELAEFVESNVTTDLTLRDLAAASDRLGFAMRMSFRVVGPAVGT